MSNLLTEYFFASRPAAIKYQLLEITHPNFSGPYRVCRNNAPDFDLSVLHEGGLGPFIYTFLPMQIRTMGSAGNMDQELEITFGDLGELLPQQIEFINNANGMQTKPSIVYREYSSIDLTLPIFGPFTLNVNAIAFNKTGAVFTAKPQAFNRGRTGEIYDVGRFPMLVGFV